MPDGIFHQPCTCQDDDHGFCRRCVASIISGNLRDSARDYHEAIMRQTDAPAQTLAAWRRARTRLLAVADALRDGELDITGYVAVAE